MNRPRLITRCVLLAVIVAWLALGAFPRAAESRLPRSPGGLTMECHESPNLGGYVLTIRTGSDVEVLQTILPACDFPYAIGRSDVFWPYPVTDDTTTVEGS